MSAENAAVVSLAREGQVLVVTIQNPPVNALSQAVRQGLADAVAQARSDAQVKAILLVGSGKAFIAGAGGAGARDRGRAVSGGGFRRTERCSGAGPDDRRWSRCQDHAGDPRCAGRGGDQGDVHADRRKRRGSP